MEKSTETNSVDGNNEQPVKQNRDYQWLLREASWQEFWQFLDQFVDWNEKREEIEKLNGDARET